MAAFLTRRDLESMERTARRARDERDRDRTQKEYVTGQLTQTLEVGVGALAVGWMGGRYGRTTLLGIDVDLLAGLAVVGAGYFGLGGRYSEHLHNLGDGILAGYLTKVGAGLGNSMRVSAGQPSLTLGEGAGAASAMIGAGGQDYSYVSEQEIAQMAQALRAA